MGQVISLTYTANCIPDQNVVKYAKDKFTESLPDYLKYMSEFVVCGNVVFVVVEARDKFPAKEVQSLVLDLIQGLFREASGSNAVVLEKTHLSLPGRQASRPIIRERQNRYNFVGNLRKRKPARR